MPEERRKEVNLLLTLLIICLMVASISVGTVGTILMSAISDMRVEISAYHEYSQSMADVRRDEIIEALVGE